MQIIDRNNRKRITTSKLGLLLLVIFLSCHSAEAFGPKGHRLVAAIAEHYLSPVTKKQVRNILKREAEYAVDGCPVKSLQDASYWPDCLKDRPQTYGYTFNWHFDNIPMCEQEAYAVYCPSGNCLSAQLEKFITTLKDKNAPARARLEALKFIAHLLGDLHQPLHMIDNNDQGGNLIKVTYFGKETNLHVVWDIELVDQVAPGAVNTEASRMSHEITDSDAHTWSASTSKDWIAESYDLAKKFAYGKLPHPPVCNVVPSGMEKLGEDYYKEVKDIEVLQLKRAGVRLAKVLNDALR